MYLYLCGIPLSNCGMTRRGWCVSDKQKKELKVKRAMKSLEGFVRVGSSTFLARFIATAVSSTGGPLFSLMVPTHFMWE